MRLELTCVGLLVELANHYTTSKIVGQIWFYRHGWGPANILLSFPNKPDYDAVFLDVQSLLYIYTYIHVCVYVYIYIYIYIYIYMRDM